MPSWSIREAFAKHSLQRLLSICCRKKWKLFIRLLLFDEIWFRITKRFWWLIWRESFELFSVASGSQTLVNATKKERFSELYKKLKRESSNLQTFWLALLSYSVWWSGLKCFSKFKSLQTWQFFQHLIVLGNFHPAVRSLPLAVRAPGNQYNQNQRIGKCALSIQAVH